MLAKAIKIVRNICFIEKTRPFLNDLLGPRFSASRGGAKAQSELKQLVKHLESTHLNFFAHTINL